jgi:hypothetical protein
VQRTAENQKILEEELFERLKEFELQAIADFLGQ